MTDDEIEKLLLDNGFKNKQLNRLRRVKKEYGVGYFTQLKELKIIFSGMTYFSFFLLFIFILLIFFSKKEDIVPLTIAFAIGFIIIYIAFPISLSRNAFKFLKKDHFSDDS